MNLNKAQSSLFLALWLTGHDHGVGSSQPIMPNANGEFEYEDEGCVRRVKVADSPLSDLISLGYLRSCGANTGSIIFTDLAELQFEEIRDTYMEMCRK